MTHGCIICQVLFRKIYPNPNKVSKGCVRVFRGGVPKNDFLRSKQKQPWLSATVTHCVSYAKTSNQLRLRRKPRALAFRPTVPPSDASSGAVEKSCEMYGLTRFIRTSVRFMTETSRIPNSDRWERNFLALQQYSQRTGHSRVPASHVELYEGRNTPIGAWVGYMRQRYRNGILSQQRMDKLQSITGWTWGPLRPGPATNTERDEQIILLRSEGKSLATIAEQVGVSRQRVHQITRRVTQ